MGFLLLFWFEPGLYCFLSKETLETKNTSMNLVLNLSVLIKADRYASSSVYLGVITEDWINCLVMAANTPL